MPFWQAFKWATIQRPWLVKSWTTLNDTLVDLINIMLRHRIILKCNDCIKDLQKRNCTGCFIFQDIPVVRQAERQKKPGRVERMNSKEDVGGIKPLSEEQAKRLDQECYERFIKVNVKHITDGQVRISRLLYQWIYGSEGFTKRLIGCEGMKTMFQHHHHLLLRKVQKNLILTVKVWMQPVPPPPPLLKQDSQTEKIIICRSPPLP